MPNPDSPAPASPAPPWPMCKCSHDLGQHDNYPKLPTRWCFGCDAKCSFIAAGPASDAPAPPRRPHPPVPRDEVHFRDDSGKLLGKIVNVDVAASPTPEATPRSLTPDEQRDYLTAISATARPFGTAQEATPPHEQFGEAEARPSVEDCFDGICAHEGDCREATPPRCTRCNRPKSGHPDDVCRVFHVVRPAEYPMPERQTPLCIHCWQTEEMHLAYSIRDGKRGCVGERHATTGFTDPAAPTPEATPPECQARDNGGYRCELPLGHAGDHRAFIDAHDDEGPIPERRWPASPTPEATPPHGCKTHAPMAYLHCADCWDGGGWAGEIPGAPRLEATAPRYVCDTCKQASPIACCTNKQCSRHGRDNDYLKDDRAPEATGAPGKAQRTNAPPAKDEASPGAHGIGPVGRSAVSSLGPVAEATPQSNAVSPPAPVVRMIERLVRAATNGTNAEFKAAHSDLLATVVALTAERAHWKRVADIELPRANRLAGEVLELRAKVDRLTAERGARAQKP